jgi:hypothetical protein
MLAYSPAAVFVNPTTACLAATYAAAKGFRCRVDNDAPTVRFHVEQCILHAQPHTLNIDSKNAIKIGFFNIGGESSFENACVIECKIQATKRGDSCFDQRLDLVRSGHIEQKQRGLAARLTNKVHGLFAALSACSDIRNYYRCTLTCIGNGRGSANTTGGARDKTGFSLDMFHDLMSF